MKTNHFNPFRFRTYRNSADNSFVLRTYKKPRGVGGMGGHDATPMLGPGPAWCRIAEPHLGRMPMRRFCAWGRWFHHNPCERTGWSNNFGAGVGCTCSPP